MKFLLQISFFLLTWFINLNATPVFAKIILPSYELSFSKTENLKEESITKIGIQNFARSGISKKSDLLNATSRENYVLEESRARMGGEVLQGAGEALSFSKTIEFGGNVFYIEGQKLNILGKVSPSNGSLGTTELIFQAPSGIKPNIVVLSTPMTAQQKAMSVLDGIEDYWQVTNIGHIDAITLNNGSIRFIHDPRVYDNYWITVADLPNSNATQIAFKQKCINEGLIKFKSFLGREYDYLISKGYVLKENGLMTKP